MLSVVIATYNRPEALQNSVRDVLEQLPPGGELVVVDQSDDDLIATLPPQARVVRLQPPSLPIARNVGVQHTSGEVILFLDDDVRLHPGCLAAHVEAFGDPTVGGTVGQIVEHEVRPNRSGTINRIGRGGRVLTNLTGRHRTEVQTLKGANMAYRRRALAAAGPFDPNYLGTAILEDADLSTRVRNLGWRLMYLPDASLDHLSVPVGGVRVGSREATERWRFHNTAYFLRRHRTRLGIRGLATFTAIAARRALEWRDPAAMVHLLRAWRDGWRLAAR